MVRTCTFSTRSRTLREEACRQETASGQEIDTHAPRHVVEGHAESHRHANRERHKVSDPAVAQASARLCRRCRQCCRAAWC
jgi:hypothetical protein